MADREHEEWLRDEEERKRLRPHPHALGKKLPPDDDLKKKPNLVTKEAEEQEAQEDADEAADDAADEAADALQAESGQ